MNRIFLLLVFLGACSSHVTFKGENDATLEETAIAETGKVDAGETPPDAIGIPGDEIIHGDAAAELDSDDGQVEACSCAELCSGAYSLRACESCYQETCPSWEGGLPQ